MSGFFGSGPVGSGNLTQKQQHVFEKGISIAGGNIIFQPETQGWFTSTSTASSSAYQWPDQGLLVCNHISGAMEQVCDDNGENCSNMYGGGTKMLTVYQGLSTYGINCMSLTIRQVGGEDGASNDLNLSYPHSPSTQHVYIEGEIAGPHATYWNQTRALLETLSSNLITTVQTNSGGAGPWNGGTLGAPAWTIINTYSGAWNHEPGIEALSGGANATYLAKFSTKPLAQSTKWSDASYWSHSGLENVDLAKVNDSVLNVKAFDASIIAGNSYLRLDVDPEEIGIKQAFTKLKIWTDGDGENQTWVVEYSDDNSTWVNIDGADITVSSAISTSEWVHSGVHRYWRIRIESPTGEGPNYYEVQFYEPVLIDSQVVDNSTNWNTAYTSTGEISLLSARWTEAFTDHLTGASFNTTDGVLTFTSQDNSTGFTVDLDGRYATDAAGVNADSVWTTVNAGSARWWTTQNTVTASGDKWWSAHDQLTAQSGYWNDAYIQTETNRQDILNIGGVSARWNATYTTLGSKSGDWVSTHTSRGEIALLSGRWNTAFDNFLTGADFNTSNGVLTFTSRDDSTAFTVDLDGRYATDSSGVEAGSVYTTVNTTSANWQSTQTMVTGSSANWQSTYTTVTAESGNWAYVAANSATGIFKTIELENPGGYAQDDIVADTLTDTLTLCAMGTLEIHSHPGTDTIIISAGPDTNAGGEANENSFELIAVAGQTDVTADNTTDTLRLAEGGNITITTADNEITFAATDTDTTYTTGLGLSSATTTFSAPFWTTVNSNSGLWDLEPGIEPLSGYANTTYLAAFSAKTLSQATKWTDSANWSHDGLNNVTLTQVNSGDGGAYETRAFDADSSLSGSYLRLDVDPQETGIRKTFTKPRIWTQDTGEDQTWLVGHSDNSINWVTVDSITVSSGTGTANWVYSGLHRYWRIFADSDFGDGPEYYEVQFYEPVLVNSQVVDNSTNWDSTHTSRGEIALLSGQWTEAFTDHLTGASFNTGNGELTFTSQDDSTAFTVDLDGRYATDSAGVEAASVFTKVNTSSASWQSTHSTVTANTTKWVGTYNTVTANSGKWLSTHNQLTAQSAFWNSTHTSRGEIALLSANWTNAYDNYIAGASFDTSDGNLTLTQRDGGTVVVDLDERYAAGTGTSGYLPAWNGAYSLASTPLYNSSNRFGINIDANLAIALTVSGAGSDEASISARDIVYAGTGNSIDWTGTHTTVNTYSGRWLESFTDHVTGASFNTTDGVLTFTSQDNSAAFTVDLDGRYITAATAGEANEYSFKTIKVTGQSDVVAETTTDDLTFAEGSNVTITTTAGTDTVTFAATDTQLTQEQVEDYVADVVVGGTNVTATYDDSAGTLTFDATDTNTTYTAGNGLLLTSTTFTLDDPANGTSIDESTIAADDRMLIWDEDASSWKYVTIDNLQDEIDTGAGAGEANEYSFKTVAVTGQDSIVADTTTDTLSVMAGDNVTIHTRAVTDTIIISAADTIGTAGLGLSLATTTFSAPFWTTVNAYSAQWWTGYSQLTSLSATWATTYSTVASESGKWSVGHTHVSNSSAKWWSTHNQLTALSAQWGTTYTQVWSESADWASAWTTVNQNSGGAGPWNASGGGSTTTTTTVMNNSATWSYPVSARSIGCTVVQNNTFTAGQVIRKGTSVNQYLLATALSAASADTIGIVKSASSTEFTYVNCGKIDIPGHGFSQGISLFLSNATPGALASQDVQDAGSVSKPLGIVIDSDTILVQPLRGVIIQGTTIASAAAGWEDIGELIRLSTAADYVSIGTAISGEKLTVAGNISATGQVIAGSLSSVGDLTVGGSITATGNLVSNGVYSHGHTQTVVPDFNQSNMQTATISSNATIDAPSNIATGATITLRVSAYGTNCNITWNSDWSFIGVKSLVIPTDKYGILSLQCFGTTNSDILASFALTN